MGLFLRVMAAGGLGSLARHGLFLWGQQGGPTLAGWVTRLDYAAGSVLLVNLLGGFLAGLATNLPPARLTTESRVVTILGFCGGFTTFSAFSQQTVELLAVNPAAALFYIGVSVVLGLLAVGLGYAIAGLFY